MKQKTINGNVLERRGVLVALRKGSVKRHNWCYESSARGVVNHLLGVLACNQLECYESTYRGVYGVFHYTPLGVFSEHYLRSCRGGAILTPRLVLIKRSIFYSESV